MKQPHLRPIDKEELVDRLMEEIEGLKELLNGYGRHHPGCSAQFGKKYHCRCGWERESKKALKETK